MNIEKLLRDLSDDLELFEKQKEHDLTNRQWAGMIEAEASIAVLTRVIALINTHFE